MPEILTDRNTCHSCHKTDGDKKLLKCASCHSITYCGPQCQRSDWTRHRPNCIPVMITEYKGKGRGLVASRDIKMGELILQDTAVIDVRAISINGECINHFVTNEIKEQMNRMSEQEKSDFYQLEQLNHDKDGCPLQSVNVFGREENFLEELKIYLKNKMSGMIFLNVSLINHSCSPNAARGKLVLSPGDPGYGLTGPRMEVRAIRNISKGEEVTTFYIMTGTTVNMMRSEIRERLKRDFGFDCKCPICKGEIPDQDNIKRKILKIIEKDLPPHDRRKASDWRRDANENERIMELTKQMHIVPFDTKCFACIDLAYAAHMARDPVLRKKAMDTWAELNESVKLEKMVTYQQTIQGYLDEWAKEFESKKPPKKEEINTIYGRQIKC